MRLPLLDDGNIDMNHFIKMVDIYMSEEISYFDTSLRYHRGFSEVAFKKAVSTRFPRDRFFLANKLSIWNIKYSEELEQIFNIQLRKTGVDYFDNYLIHSLNGDLYKKCLDLKIFEFLQKIRKEGRANHIGFSYHGSFEDYVMILDNIEVDFVQLQINYYDMEEGEAKKIYEYTYKKNIPIIVMEAIRGGTLANMPNIIEDKLKNFNMQSSFASLALRYVLSLPGITTVLSGMSRIDQLIENLDTVKNYKNITKEENEVIKSVIQSLKEFPTIKCTNCKYCYKCPVGIPIYDIFNLYNKCYINKNENDKININILFHTINKCISCGHCSEVCPQNIDIQKIFYDINKKRIYNC